MATIGEPQGLCGQPGPHPQPQANVPLPALPMQVGWWSPHSVPPPGLLVVSGWSLVRGESREEGNDRALCPGLAVWHLWDQNTETLYQIHSGEWGEWPGRMQEEPLQTQGFISPLSVTAFQTLSPPSSPWWLRPSWCCVFSVCNEDPDGPCNCCGATEPGTQVTFLEDMGNLI